MGLRKTEANEIGYDDGMLIISIVSSNHSFEKYMNKPCTAILMGCVFARIYNVSKNEQQTI